MVSGSVVSGVVAAVALAGVVVAFANGGSPYVTWAEAQKMKSDTHVHLAGDLLKNTVSQDVRHHQLRFQLRDQDGTIVNVVHTGEMPANLSEVTKIVAEGHAEGNIFASDKLLVKCPSKYEAQPKSTSSSYPQS
jgi:cytochrome c-type biogenesis protein CcmE